MGGYEERYDPEFPPLGMVSIWFGVALIGITAVAHLLTDSSAGLWANPVMTSLQLALVALIIGSLLYLLLRVGDGAKLAAVPLIINIGTLLIVRFVPFGGLWQEIHFQWLWADYNKVVQLVESGALRPDEQGYIRLPLRFRALVTDDVIRLDTSEGITRIFFYTKKNSSLNFSGYLDRSDNSPPQTGDFDGRWRYVVQKRPFWFYCSSY